jgi:hypothetical protein
MLREDHLHLGHFVCFGVQENTTCTFGHIAELGDARLRLARLLRLFISSKWAMLA